MYEKKFAKVTFAKSLQWPVYNCLLCCYLQTTLYKFCYTSGEGTRVIKNTATSTTVTTAQII